MDAELLHRSRLREVEIWIAWVRAHGGSLEVESEPEQGSTFTFSLPTSGD